MARAGVNASNDSITGVCHLRLAEKAGWTEVKAQRRGSDVKHLAKVLSIGWECDAAVLTVENVELFGPVSQ